MSESEKKNTKVTTQTLWDAAAPMIAVTEKHPFLVSMVDGTLAEENFMYYLDIWVEVPVDFQVNPSFVGQVRS